MDFIKDHDKQYAITKDGDVYLLKKLKLNTSGNYPRVRLHKDGKQTSHTIHRLLAQHFIPNPDNLPEVDHIDRDCTNNNLDNLRWVSRSTNQKNRVFKRDNGLPKGVYETGNMYRSIKWNGIKNICLGTYETIDEAKSVYDTTEL